MGIFLDAGLDFESDEILEVAVYLLVVVMISTEVRHVFQTSPHGVVELRGDRCSIRLGIHAAEVGAVNDPGLVLGHLDSVRVDKPHVREEARRRKEIGDDPLKQDVATAENLGERFAPFPWYLLRYVAKALQISALGMVLRRS